MISFILRDDKRRVPHQESEFHISVTSILRFLTGNIKARTRVGVVWSLLSPLLLIGISNPQIAFAAPSVSLPTTLTADTSFSNVNSAGALSIGGYSAGATIQVTVSATSGNLKISTTAGLTVPTGYTSAAWTSNTSTEIAFSGSQSDVSAALNSLQYKASAVDASANITVTSFLAGAAYNPATGHFYEIVDNGSVINWELARCKALYSNADVSFSAGASQMNTNGCISATSLTRKTLGGLSGYLANITSLAEQEFIFRKLTSTGWIGGADTDLEGEFIWMDGPERGQVFWKTGLSRRTTNTVTGSQAGFSYGSDRFNYFNDGEPNNSNDEDFAEFGFGTNGSWNDCRNACGRTKYVIEYGETGDTLSGASGTINVNPRTAINTETDTALALSGSQYLYSGQESPFDIAAGTTFTLEAWVRPTIINANQILLGKSNQYSLYISSNGSFGMNFYTTTTPSGSVGDTSIFRANSVRANEWQHVAVVRNGTTVTGYINGQAVGELTGAAAGSIKTGSSNFVVGGYSAADQPFTGQIDQVRVWSSARAASDLQSGMTSFIPNVQTSLIAAYGFNESTGTKIYDNATSAIWETDLTLSGGNSSWSQIAETSTVAAHSLVTFRRSFLTSAGGWRVPSGATRVSVLVVGGGGGGAGQYTVSTGEAGAGGGGGGVYSIGAYPMSTSSFVSVRVGVGGVGGFPVADRQSIGQIGGTSSFGLLTGGGGGGATRGAANPNFQNGLSGTGGGGGGGASIYYDASAVGTGGLGVDLVLDGRTYPGRTGGNGATFTNLPSSGSGGGAGGAATTTSGLVSVVGPGVTDSITGSAVVYGRGGGGGGSSGQSGSGFTFTAIASIAGNGGDGYSSTTPNGGYGVSGANGVVILKWITASAPVFTQPTNDTTTAGLTDTMTVSANPISPLTRSYQWQFSNNAESNWLNVSAGSGGTTNTYTTPVLETTTSGSQFRYRVIVTDSDTAGLFIVDTSTSVFITINPRIAITGSYTNQKYGASHTDTFTVQAGTGTGAITLARTSGTRAGVTWDTSTALSARVSIGTTLIPGSYIDTITATDSKGAQTLLAVTITVSKADTLTVTSLSRIDTFTASALTYIDSYTVTGLKNSDTVTAISYAFTGTANDGTVYANAVRPALAGSYSINPVPTILNSTYYESVTAVAGTLTINRANRTLTLANPLTPLKYGSSLTLSASASAGVGDGTISYLTSTPLLCALSANSAQALKSAGTCSFTSVISQGSNYESATAAAKTTTLTKADTLTVTANNPTAVTYTGLPAVITPTAAISGLVLSDVANSISYFYGESDVIGVSGGTCSTGGTCVVGNIGPGGGVVFYVGSSKINVVTGISSGGLYLEAAPPNWSGGATDPSAVWATSPSNGTVVSGTVQSVGSGAENTRLINVALGSGGVAAKLAADLVLNGQSDWFLPSDFELQAMYNTIKNSASAGLTNSNYWASNQAVSAGQADTWWFGTNIIAPTDKLNPFKVRPIRAFSPLATGAIPTNAGAYNIIPRTLTLTSSEGSDPLTNYQAVTYNTGTLTINRAQQAALVIAEFGALFGTPYKVLVLGGSGLGAITRNVTAGTASGCAISGETLTSTTVGTCIISATKARDINYETATATASVYFILYVLSQPAPAAGSGSTIALSGATALVKEDPQTTMAPLIQSFSSSAVAVGQAFTITGLEFNAGSLQVQFSPMVNGVVNSSSATSINVTVPVGAGSGPVSVITANGMDFWFDFTVLP